jgi:serine/threonine protein phosphatase 1
MTARVIAIGDIHGSAAALAAMVRAIKPTVKDTLIILGDCVDRGPDSRGVIELLFSLRKCCRLVPILGNHEEMMLDHLDGREPRHAWLPFGGESTLRSYKSAGIAEGIDPAHVDYVRTWKNFYEHDDHFFVHGAYDDQLPLNYQDWQNLRWHSLRTSVPRPHFSGKTAIVGHTSQKDGKIWDLGHVVCIDTYCWGGGWLTALDVTTGDTWQVDREGRRHVAEPSVTAEFH